MNLARRCIVGTLALAGSLASAAAQAQTARGTAVSVELGSANFINESTRELTRGAGFYLGVRAAYGTRSRLGVEGGYVLTAQGLSESRFRGQTPSLFGHGVEAALRANLPLSSGHLLYAPFAVVGLGWTAYVRTDETQMHAFNARSTDHVGIVPMGAGLAAAYGYFYGEARLMYRPVFGADELSTVTGGSANLQSWSAGLAIGVQF
jgi:hypothetical protein